jgi:hypothetical protein
VGVAGDQLDPGQAAGGQVPEEGQPAGAVLAGGHLDAQDLAVSVSVDAGGDQGVHRHHAATLADLEHEGVGGHEGERAGVLQAAGAELFDVFVQVLGHHRHLRLGQAGDTQGGHQLVHPPGRDAQEVAGRHHRGQCTLGSLAALKQPLGEVGALPQLGDRDVEGPGASVEIAVAVAVAAVHPLVGHGAVLGAAYRVGLGRQQGIDEGLQQLAQQIGTGLGELFFEQTGRVDTGPDGHRWCPSSSRM